MEARIPALLALPLALGCGEREAEAQGALALDSAAFEVDGAIPEAHTCDGADTSPPLSWTGAPPGTRSFALVVDDADAPQGPFTHWLVYDLPPDARAIEAGRDDGPSLPSGAEQGRNDFGEVGWNGPCPPPGPAHRYRFELLALDTDTLGLGPGARAQQVQVATRGHVIERATLGATYGR